MKKITNKGKGNTRSVLNVSKKGFNASKLLVYKRYSNLEEYAILRKVDKDLYGWISLIGCLTCPPVWVNKSFKKSLAQAAKLREVYQFDSLKEFIDNKNRLK